MTATYLARLAARTAATGTVLCVGVDPDPAALPDGLPRRRWPASSAFARLIVEAALPVAAAVKPNLAFFEAYGSAGLAALERLRALVPAGRPVHRGREARRHRVDRREAGRRAVRRPRRRRGHRQPVPRARRRSRRCSNALDRFAYVLCRTSNPGAAELQGLVVAADDASGAPAEPLWARVARRAATWGPGGTVGLVVGATAPAELGADPGARPGPRVPRPGRRRTGRRDRAGPRGTVPRPRRPAGGRPGGGLLVNVSRGIARAAVGRAPAGSAGDPGERLAEAAADWARRLAVLP